MQWVVSETCKGVFEDIYTSNVWEQGCDGNGDGSGSGSDIEFTKNLRSLLFHWIQDHGVKKMLDSPCGSGKWVTKLIREVQTCFPDFVYHGVDVSEVCLARARANTEGILNVSFAQMDLSMDPLPSGYDLVFCRDALQHLCQARVFAVLRNIAASGATWIMLGGYEDGSNEDINDGGYFNFNPTLPPYNLVCDMVFSEGHPPIQRAKSIFVFYGYKLREQLSLSAMDSFITYAIPFGYQKLRLGSDRDGGYVIAHNTKVHVSEEGNKRYDLCISCGIGGDPSFDNAFAAMYPGTPQLAFDGTVSRPHNMDPSIVFHQKNIAVENTPETSNLHDYLNNTENVFLKMDIEGHEWKWILATPTDVMRKFRQIVIELHGFWDDGWCATVEEKKRAAAKLAETHVLVHVHGNNYGHMSSYAGVDIPWVGEFTYMRRDEWGDAIPQLNTEPFPIHGLDMPNNVAVPDLVLDKWPYVCI